MVDVMDWHMYLILFIAIIVFIGIALLLERAKKKPKDPLSIWNPDNFSLYFDGDTKSHLPRDQDDIMTDPAYEILYCNIWHDSPRESHYIEVGNDPFFDPMSYNLNKY